MTPTVLVVDDDPMVLASFRRMMREVCAELTLTSTLREAKEAFARASPSAVICDYRLPDGDGLSFLEWVHTQTPWVKRVLYTGEAVARTSIGLDIPVIAKPCPPGELREFVESVIGANTELPAGKE